MTRTPNGSSTGRTPALCAAAAASCLACDAQLGDPGRTVGTVGPDGFAEMTMTPPDDWPTFRMVDLDRLRLSVTLDGVSQVTTRVDTDRWTVSFVLPDDNSHTVQATWFEQLPDRTMTLAVSEEVPVSNVQAEREIRISNFSHFEFDEDNDAISNLDERRLGLDPLTPDLVAPGAGQTDCRANTASNAFGNFFVAVENPGFAAPLAVASTATVSDLRSGTTDGMLVVFESFFLLTPGELTVSHLGGPAGTGALLYDTDLNGTLRELARDNIPLTSDGTTFENRRAVVSRTLEPGLYCYRLESIRIGEQVIDPALQYSFVASP